MTDTAYQVRVSPGLRRFRVEFGGQTIAESDHVLVVEETRLAPTYYFPRTDVRIKLLTPTAYTTHCPFKGNASHWDVGVDGTCADNAAWSYETPLPDAAEIDGYVAFDWDAMDAWFADDEPLSQPQPSDDPGSNPYVSWLLHGARRAQTPGELVDSFSNTLSSQGVPLLRFGLLIRTLHPQLFAWGFNWWRNQEDVYEYQTPHDTLLKSEYQDSPYAPILAGAGGVRRSLRGDTALDFPVLAELREAGGTDYVAMPMSFSDGQLNIITLVSDAPDGFSLSDLGEIHEVLPILSAMFEVFALRRVAAVLLETYLGSHTGAKVLNGQIKRGDGESIHSVIWFCDLRDSTQLTEATPRLEYLQLLNRYFDATAGAVIDHGGEVLKFIGDAVLAIFPIATRDEPSPAAAHAAIAAARDAQRRVVELNAARSDRSEPSIGFGIALHRGDFTYGNIGTSGRLDFTIIGGAVNETARIEGLTKTLGEPVLISAALAASFPELVVSVGEHSLRGVGSPQELFRLADL